MPRRHPLRSQLPDIGTPDPRPGFTVIEVLVALVVVSVGMLGVAAVSSSALRASSAAAREQAAVQRARSRIARLDAEGCSAASAGEELLPGGLVDRWTLDPVVNGVRLVDVRAEWNGNGRRRAVLLRSALLC